MNRRTLHYLHISRIIGLLPVLAIAYLALLPMVGIGGDYEAVLNRAIKQQKEEFGILTRNLPESVVKSLFLAQLEVESSFNPHAVSSKGAQGIAQFMPSTWAQFGEGGDPFDPDDAIPAQIRYMAYLYERFSEIPGPMERFKFALAAYNSGPANVNQALALARESLGQPRDYSDWARDPVNGRWQVWSYTSRFFFDVLSEDNAHQVTNYVSKVLDSALLRYVK